MRCGARRIMIAGFVKRFAKAEPPPNAVHSPGMRN